MGDGAGHAGRSDAPGDAAGDALDDALRSAIARCAEIGQRHGGWAAAALGDELLIYFGYPRASEDDARRAARAAHAITAAAGAAGPAVGGVLVEVGIGLHSGLAVDGGPGTLDGAGPATGATPRLAARLAALAPPGATIVSAAARRLLRTAFDLAAEGVQAIDGAAPVEVFRLGDERREPDGATLEGARTPIAGREPELALLVERWRRACEGAGQSSLITGEAGIGKSRLARELRDRVAREPHSFLDLRCSPDTRNSALAAVVDLLERALGLDRERDARGRIARLEAELARHGATPADAMPLFLPLFALPIEPPYRPVEVSPQRQRVLTLDAIVALLFAIAERAPVLLLAEDLHWADPTTIELVTRLVREAPDGPLCLVMTARPEFSPAFSTAGVLMLPLTRLGRPHTEQMVGALVHDKALPPAAVEHIAHRADGVPLFVEELLHMMIDTGVLVERADRYELVGSLSDARIPGTLRALLTARLDRLSRARETAQLAAALGREFSVDVLTAASPEDPAVVAEDVERLVLAGLVLRKRRGKDAVGLFKHALLRDAAYDSLATGARHDAHARIAAVLEERFPEVARTRPDLLAHHHAAAEHKPRAVVYAQRAAEHGLQRSMYAEAIAHAANAIAWADALHGADGVEAELSANGALIQALMATRGWADPQVKAVADRSARLLDQLEPDSKHRVPTLWSLFTYHHVASHRGTARSVAEQLVAIAERSGEAGFAAAAAMLHGLALFIDGDHAAARPVFERAVALYDPALHRDHGARFGLDSLVLARAFLAHLRWFAGDASDAFALVASAIAWARELGHVPSIALGLLYGCTIHQRAGDRSAVAAMAGEILALSARYGLPAYEGYAATLHAWATGDDERARAIVGALGGLGCKLALSYYASLVADSEAERGELDAAISCIDHCLSLCRDNDEHFYEPELHRRRALYEARKDPSAEGVRTSLEHAARLARRQDMPRIEVLATLDLVRRFGGIEQRRARLDELLALHPGLRELDSDPHQGGSRWAWTN